MNVTDERIAVLEAELASMTRRWEVLSRLVNCYLVVRNCKLCRLPNAQGYVCCHCGGDDSQED